MSEVKVRFTEGEVCPHRGNNVLPRLPPGSWERWRGKECWILLPPEEPDPYISCGTRCVWRVAPRTIKALGLRLPRAPRRYVVCEHQVEVD